MKVKNIISTVAMATMTMAAQAQTSEMTVNGLKVIFKPSPKQTVSAVMFFKGGTANYTEKQQGIESLTLAATTECGTKNHSKDSFKDIADKYGISLGGSSSYDYGYINMSCVKPYLKEGWELFAEAVNNPVFEEKELGLLQQKLEANLKQEEGDPDSKLSDMSMSSTFKGTRYAYKPSGTPASIAAFKRAEVAAYYKNLQNKENMLLVVVGNMSATELKTMVEKAFATLPSAAKKSVLTAQDFKVTANTTTIENRELATNYIMGLMGAPKVTDAKFNAYRLAFDILSDKLFEEVRTKRNLSYAPSAFASGGMQPYSGIYVTTTKPKEAVTVMVDEIKRLRNGGFTAVELRDAKSQFATSYFMKNESNGSIAMALGVAEIRSSWKNEEAFLERINAVTLPEMQSTFSEYTDGICWSYLSVEAQADKE
ncbi:MAG TPA: pitrilysin family protein, partial [Chitinophagaceae bacterium]|nr:pitrilysin family protein [Chitinophagaceae bacterium]